MHYYDCVRMLLARCCKYKHKDSQLNLTCEKDLGHWCIVLAATCLLPSGFVGRAAIARGSFFWRLDTYDCEHIAKASY